MADNNKWEGGYTLTIDRAIYAFDDVRGGGFEMPKAEVNRWIKRGHIAVQNIT